MIVLFFYILTVLRYKVKLCGILRRIQPHEKYIDYTVHDGTGSIDARVW